MSLTVSMRGKEKGDKLCTLMLQVLQFNAHCQIVLLSCIIRRIKYTVSCIPICILFSVTLHAFTLHPQFPFPHILMVHTLFILQTGNENSKSSRENHLKDNANLHIKDSLCCVWQPLLLFCSDRWTWCGIKAGIWEWNQEQEEKEQSEWKKLSDL